VLNQPANATKQISSLEAKLADLQKKAAATKPKVLAVNGAPRTSTPPSRSRTSAT